MLDAPITQADGDLADCTPAAGLATVQVHGTFDVIAPYPAVPLVAVEGGGHNWPGFSGPLNLPITLYGPTANGFFN